MAGEKKQALRDKCDARGIPWKQSDTIKDLEAKVGKSGGSAPARARVQTRTRAGSSVSRSGGSRPRTAALAKSAPTVKVRVDERQAEQARQPGSADILAVALVVFMCVLAALNTPAKGEGVSAELRVPTLEQVAQRDPRLDWVYKTNGVPRFKQFTHVTRLIEVCWDDGAGLIAWQPVPSGCWRPDLRTQEGQLWQARIDTITYPNSAVYAPLVEARK